MSFQKYWDLRPETLSPEQRKVYEMIKAGPRGLVAGPLAVWLHSPQLAQTAQALGAHCRYNSHLEPRLSELAIVMVGAHWRAGYEWLTHAPLARAAGISEGVLEAIRTGGLPVFANHDEAAVYAFMRELLTTHTVSEPVFAEAEKHLGTAGVVDLTGIAGYYTLISMTIRAFRVPTQDGADDPFTN